MKNTTYRSPYFRGHSAVRLYRCYYYAFVYWPLIKRFEHIYSVFATIVGQLDTNSSHTRSIDGILFVYSVIKCEQPNLPDDGFFVKRQPKFNIENHESTRVIISNRNKSRTIVSNVRI